MRDRMRDFRSKFEELVAVCIPLSDMWIASHLVPRDGRKEEVETLKQELAYLGGLAEPGVVEANAYIRTETETRTPMVLSPAAAWLSTMQPKPMLSADDVLSACRSAEGRLQVMAEERASVEGCLAWKLACLIGWPRSVRDLAGFTAASRAGRATVWTLSGLLFALATGVLGSFLFAIIVATAGIRF